MQVGPLKALEFVIVAGFIATADQWINWELEWLC